MSMFMLRMSLLWLAKSAMTALAWKVHFSFSAQGELALKFGIRTNNSMVVAWINQHFNQENFYSKEKSHSTKKSQCFHIIKGPKCVCDLIQHPNPLGFHQICPTSAQHFHVCHRWNHNGPRQDPWPGGVEVSVNLRTSEDHGDHLTSSTGPQGFGSFFPSRYSPFAETPEPSNAQACGLSVHVKLRFTKQPRRRWNTQLLEQISEALRSSCWLFLH